MNQHPTLRKGFSLSRGLKTVLGLSAGAISACVSLFGQAVPAHAFLLVGNTRGNSVSLIDKNGLFVKDFIPTGSGGLTSPDDLVYGPDGNLYISSGSGSTGQILRYNGQTGAFIDVFASGGGLIRPYGIAFGPDGYLYVSSFLTDEILRFDAITGAFVDVFAKGNGQPGGLNGPNDLLFTPSGQLLVTTQGSIAVPGDADGDGVVEPGEFVASFPGLPSQILSYNITTGASTVFADMPAPDPQSFGFVSFLGLAFNPKGDLVTTDFANGIRIYDPVTGALKTNPPISTNYTTAPGTTSNNFIGNLTFIGDALYVAGFDFTQNNAGAVLKYSGSTGSIFTPTTPNLQRPIGVVKSPVAVPEPTTTAGLLAVGALGAIAMRKRKSNPVG